MSGYRVEVTGDLLGAPNPAHFRDKDLGNVTSWTLDTALGWGTVNWWHVLATNAAGQTECTGSWRKFTVRAQAFSGTIDSATPSSFTGNQTSNLTVKATYTGDGTVDLAVKVLSKPTGWTVDNGLAGDFIRVNSVSTGQQKDYTPFKVTPPAAGGSGTIVWELWKVSGVGLTTFDQKLTNYNQSVSASDNRKPPIINAIDDGATHPGRTYTGPTPSLSQGGDVTPITWSLVTKPSSMTIDSVTGVVTWTNPLASASAYTVTIRATNAVGYDDETWALSVYNSRIISVSPNQFPSSGKANITVTVKNEIPSVVGTKYKIIASYVNGWTISPASQDTTGGILNTGNISDNGLGTAVFEVTPPVGGATTNVTWSLQWYDGDTLRDGLSNFTQSMSATTNRVKIILDTDLASDCDDLGVVAMLHAYANQGKVDILAMVCNVSDSYSPLCLDAINTYYGRPDILIGYLDGNVSPTGIFPYYNQYTDDIANHFARDLTASAVPSALAIYRQVLSANSNVTIVSVGSLYNLEQLLRTEPALVSNKVAKLVVMGGGYPNPPNPPYDFNFSLASSASEYVLAHWPGEIVFTGLGGDVITGDTLRDPLLLPIANTGLFNNPEVDTNNPIRLGYEVGTAQSRIDNGFLGPLAFNCRPSWDQIALLYAVEGPGTYFCESEGGLNRIIYAQVNLWNPYNTNQTWLMEAACNSWTPMGEGLHRYLLPRSDKYTLEAKIDTLMTAKVPTVIRFDSITPNPIALGSADLDLVNSGILSANAGQPLALKSSNSNVISIVDGIKLRFLAAGSSVITASFLGNLCFEAAQDKSQSIQVVELNMSPTNIFLSNSTVLEYQPTGTAVGSLSTADPDNANIFTYSLVSGEGSTDNSYFSVNGSNLVTAVSLNYTVKSNCSIRIQSMDQGGLSTQKVFSVNVNARIIGVSGNLSFGSVLTGQTSTASMIISNRGNSVLSITGIGYPQGFSGPYWNGSIMAGKSTNIIVSFSPTLVKNYAGNITVTNNSTSGSGVVSISGTGIGGIPLVLYDANFGVLSNRFGFNFSGASGKVVVVDTCTNLINPIWAPLQTNTLTGSSFYFGDSRWTNFIGRFYRLRSQ